MSEQTVTAEQVQVMTPEQIMEQVKALQAQLAGFNAQLAEAKAKQSAQARQELEAALRAELAGIFPMLPEAVLARLEAAGAKGFHVIYAIDKTLDTYGRPMPSITFAATGKPRATKAKSDDSTNNTPSTQRPVSSDWEALVATNPEWRAEDEATIARRLAQAKERGTYHGDAAKAKCAIEWNVKIARLHSRGVSGY